MVQEMKILIKLDKNSLTYNVQLYGTATCNKGYQDNDSNRTLDGWEQFDVCVASLK